MKSVTPAEAARLVQAGKCRILDVRTAQEFEDVHPEGALNAQFYRLIKEWTPRDILRRAGFAFFGVFNGTEENPDFLAGALRPVRAGATVHQASESGGSACLVEARDCAPPQQLVHPGIHLYSPFWPHRGVFVSRSAGAS